MCHIYLKKIIRKRITIPRETKQERTSNKEKSGHSLTIQKLKKNLTEKIKTA